MPTLDDIAQVLGVSKGTVSKALNMAEDISPAMRQTIIEKAVEMGYTRSPRGKNPPRLAIFISNMEYACASDFGYDIILGFRKAAQPSGYHVELIPLDRQMQCSMGYDAYMLQHNYMGAFFLGLSLEDPWMKDFPTCTSPTAILDSHIGNNPLVTQVGVDNVEGMQLAVSYLKSLGHTKIGYLGSALKSYVYRQRYDAFFQALHEQGIQQDMDLVGIELNVMDCLFRHLPRILERGCTAIMCSHDVLANAALVYCTELGKSVPGDVSILGFDDIPLCQYTLPPLTTVQQNRCEIGKSGFYALFNQFKGIPLASLLLHPKLVCRGSCSGISTK